MALYFIAIIPEAPLREKVKHLKLEMQARFNAQHALKSPAHITLQMPFKRAETDEADIIPSLETWALKQTPFKIQLKDFGCFTPRVIYINIDNSSPIQQLQKGLKKNLVNLGFDQKELTQKIHPHMTIATRDLRAEQFYKAWPEFDKRNFKAEFMASSIFLLKHNGKFWDILSEFEFNKH